MKISIKAVTMIANGIERLSQMDEAGKLKTIKDEVRYMLFKNLRAAAAIGADAERMRQRILKEVFADEPISEQSPKFITFIQRYNDFSDTLEECTFEQIDPKELIAAGVPVGLINMLSPILKDT